MAQDANKIWALEHDERYEERLWTPVWRLFVVLAGKGAE